MPLKKVTIKFDLLSIFIYKGSTERENDMAFLKIPVKKSLKKNGQLRKTKLGNGVCLTLQMQVSLTDEMAAFIESKAEKLDIKYGDYIRSLIFSEMLKEEIK